MMNRPIAVTWEESCLTKFSRFFGLTIGGFEGEFLDMVKGNKKTGVVYKGKGGGGIRWDS